MSKPRTITVGGPWRGMEWRESQQSDQHCQLAINVDFSRGYVESRLGFKAIDEHSDGGFVGRIFITDTPVGDRYILRVGYSVDDAEMQFQAFNQWGASVGSEQSLLTDFGDPSKKEFKCSFVNASLTSDTSDPRFVTLVFTTHTVYVYDPAEDVANLRKANLAEIASGGDTIRLNDVNFAYHITAPGGFIAVEHQGKVFRAGYSRNQKVTLSNTLEAQQNLVPEGAITQNRGVMQFDPHIVTYSDEFDPLAIQAHHMFSVEAQEIVTGLRSFQENLVLFTDQSLYILSGSTDADYALHRMYSGVGCASHSSIVQVGGSLYYAGFDGFYRWTGNGKPEKLTEGIEEMWTGRYTTDVVADEMAAMLTTLGHPWLIDHAHMGLVSGVHYHETDQILWSIPLAGQASGYTMDAVLVYNIPLGAWAIYMTNNDCLQPPMLDGVVERRRGREQLWTLSPNKSLLRYGSGYDESSTADRGAPMVWGSARLRKGNQGFDQVNPFWFRLASKGKTPALQPPRVAFTGDSAGHDQVATEQSADLSTHPDQTSKDYFFGTGRFNSTKFNAIGWFSSKVNAKLRTQSFQIWISDDSDSRQRGQLVCMQDFTYDIKAGDNH
jgi:hypothetical protein